MGQLETGGAIMEQLANLLPLDDPNPRIKVFFGGKEYNSQVSCSYYSVDSGMIQSCTVGWLLSETIRQLRLKFGDKPFCKQFSFRHIVGLRLRDGTDLLDFWLTQYERIMPPLRENDELEVLFSGRRVCG
jgi:hypothetical protein